MYTCCRNARMVVVLFLVVEVVQVVMMVVVSVVMIAEVVVEVDAVVRLRVAENRSLKF
ncbi:hypothetical protein DPMN_132632 [Dreissena polymorpha]|uniref:Transmembrane protein n=1 Tax=Dreissena polymorpha TaxID=45954 RepID=A0A9D4JDA0_DREPO|nr:hypothetical protein DPMN_132632 [Dreissena polymorpha]